MGPSIFFRSCARAEAAGLYERTQDQFEVVRSRTLISFKHRIENIRNLTQYCTRDTVRSLECIQLHLSFKLTLPQGDKFNGRYI